MASYGKSGHCNADVNKQAGPKGDVNNYAKGFGLGASSVNAISGTKVTTKPLSPTANKASVTNQRWT